MKRTPYTRSKANKLSRIIFWITIIITVLFLITGCARTTPTESIIDNHIQLVDETLDYAKNNMGNDPDTIFLINSLKTCKTGLLNAQQSHKSEISTCEAEVRYWRLASFSLFIALCISIFIIIKRFFR